MPDAPRLHPDGNITRQVKIAMGILTLGLTLW